MTNETPQTSTQQLVAVRRQQYFIASTYTRLVESLLLALCAVLATIAGAAQAQHKPDYPMFLGAAIAAGGVYLIVSTWYRSVGKKRCEAYIQAREAAAVEAYIAQQSAINDAHR